MHTTASYHHSLSQVDELPTTQPVPTTQPGSVSISVSITPVSGTNTAGETYSLECSATVTGSIDQPAITWLDPMNSTVPSGMVTTTGTMSTLTFNPLSASHAGTYTCRATVGSTMQTATMDVTVESECSVCHHLYSHYSSF